MHDTTHQLSEEEYTQTLKAFLSDPLDPAKRQAFKHAANDLPADPEFAAMSEEEKFEDFYGVYWRCPLEHRTQLLEYASLLAEALTENENENIGN
jgi:hypothetical protein